MKVIISHDVDHITILEHKDDLIIPKFIARSVIELTSGKISSKETKARVFEFLDNKWQNLEALMAFDKEKKVDSTFFLGVSKGRGLKYDLNTTRHWARKIRSNGFDIGVHGISFNNFTDMRKEFEAFKRVSGLLQFGVRIHYLLLSQNTLSYLERCGYLFDTSVYEVSSPYKYGHLWEFPLHIMDGNIFHMNTRWQNVSLKEAKVMTKMKIRQVLGRNIDYLTILFHDRYFSEGFEQWRDWYIWLIEYLVDQNIEFISYKNALAELESYKN